MGKGFEIDAALNARDFQRGTKDIEAALEDVADALDDTTKDAEKAGRKIGDELSDGAEDAERAVERLERSFKEVADASKRETAKAGDAVRKNIAKDGGDAVKEWGDEAKQNVAETFSSFRGETEDFVGIIQDTFGGVISNLGPVGMAAGAAGALGIGLMMGAFEDAQEKEQAFRERVAELADVLIETGGEGADAVQAIADRLRSLATETDEDAMNFDKLRAMAADMNVEFSDLAQAYVKGGGSLQTYISQLDDRIAAERRAYRESTQYLEGATIGNTALGIELEGQRDKLKDVADAYSEAEQDAKDWAESGGAAIAARAEQMEQLQGELDEAIGSWGDYIDAETGATDPAAYLAAMKARMDATANFNTNVQQLAAQFGLTAAEVQTILDQGVDFAPMLQSIIDSGLGEQYATQIRAMLDGGQAIVDGQPTTATVQVQTDADAAAAQLDQATADRDTKVTAEADTAAAALDLQSLISKKRTTSITAEMQLSAAQRALDSFISKPRTTTIIASVVDREGNPVP